MLQFSPATHLSSSVPRASPEGFAAPTMACLSQKSLCQQRGVLVKHCFCKAFYRKDLSSCYGEASKLQVMPNRKYQKKCFYKYHLNGSGRHSSALADFPPECLDTMTVMPTVLTELESSRDDTRLNA